MRVIVLGGTGLIGHRLSYWLVRERHEVIVLSRNSQAKKMPPNVQGARWDGYSPFGWGHLIDEQTVIVNMAGHNPANWRWTDAHKNRVLMSRLDTTQAVAEAVAAAKRKPYLVVQASAVGYYGDHGESDITEATASGEGFRSDVCVEWEEAAERIQARTAILRIGVVLSRAGGFLPPLQTAARLTLRALGSGAQWVPWVHVDDVAHAISFLISQPDSGGVYNLTAPYPVTNYEFMATLAEVMGTARLLPAPASILRLALGEQAGVVLDSQKVLSNRMIEAGYKFKFPTLEVALDNLVRRK
ncbi:MAG: TIGR01777 family oxidoreductase [Chloroflexota bacterium]|nr:TIGR01777 family oxidoreductase [Chloroflexota bacterium]